MKKEACPKSELWSIPHARESKVYVYYKRDSHSLMRAQDKIVISKRRRISWEPTVVDILTKEYSLVFRKWSLKREAEAWQFRARARWNNNNNNKSLLPFIVFLYILFCSLSDGLDSVNGTGRIHGGIWETDPWSSRVIHSVRPCNA